MVCPTAQLIIHLLKLVDYLYVKAHKKCSMSILYWHPKAESG